MASIRCGNCQGYHDTVAEVRACHATRPAVGPSLFDEPPEMDASWRAPTEPTSAAPRLRAPHGDAPPALPSDAAPADLAALAGPDVLGRNLVVSPGASAPPPWAAAPRFTLDDTTDHAALADTLHALWSSRERFVVELAVPFDAPPAEADHRDPWRLSAGFEFAGDRLHHLVWSNSVDARDPARPRFVPRDQALAAGAQPAPSGETGTDVVPRARRRSVPPVRGSVLEIACP